jgi:hypothetical protein
MKNVFLPSLAIAWTTKLRKNARVAAIALLAAWLALPAGALHAQTTGAKKRVVVDVAHGQKFYNDPAGMAGMDSARVARVKYMTGELAKNAGALNAEVGYQKTTLTAGDLAKCDLLFIHMPSAKYTPDEVKAIRNYLQKGGSMFIVMEVDYWSTLQQANVNDLVNPFGIVFKEDNPDGKSSGGYSKESKVTAKRYRIPYHGARLVEGGTPFCFSNQTEANPFGVYQEVNKGGKIIAMGDGMSSLYMTSWEGVNDYQCAPFMQEALAWLLN